MRDQLAHRYFDTSHAIVEHTVTTDLAELTAAVQALLDDLPGTDTERTRRLCGRPPKFPRAHPRRAPAAHKPEQNRSSGRCQPRSST